MSDRPLDAPTDGSEKVYTLSNSGVYHRTTDCIALARRAKWREIVVLTPEYAQGDTWYWGRRRACALCAHEEPNAV